MDWPILDRPSLLVAARERLALRPFGAVLLTGPSGAGKTTIARRLAETWTGGGETVEVVGMAELQEAPLAAFARQVDELAAAPTEPLTRALTARIGRRDPLPLLVVDDAPLLDPSSAAVVYQLVRVYGVPAVLTARSDHPLSGPIERIVHEGLAQVLAVPGLDREEVREVLRRRFAAMPRPDDVARLHRQCAGNPLLLRDLVRRTEQWGGVRAVAAGVELEPVDVPADPAAAAAARVASLDAAEREVLARVAVGAGAPAGVLLPPPALRTAARLVDRGLLVRAADAVLRPAHPLVGEGALALLDDGEHRRVLHEVADRLTATGEPAHRFTAVVLRCATLDPPGSGELEWAVGHAYGQGEHLLVLELHRHLDQVASSGPSVRALVQRAGSLSWLDRLDEADAAFEQARTCARSSADLALLASCWGTHLAYRRFDVAAAVALAEQVQPGLEPAERALLAPELHTWRTLSGEVGAFVAEHPAVPGAGAGSAVAVRAAVAAVMLEAMAGGTGQDAARVLTELEREHGVLEPHAAAMVHLQRYFALLARGCGAEAEGLVEDQRAASSADASGIWSYTLAIHLMYGGRLTRAAELALLAQEQLRWRDPIGLLGAARVLRAVIAVQQGDAAGARRLLDTVPDEQRTDPKAAMLLAEAEALLLASAGDPDAAARIVETCAVQAHQQGFGLVAAISLSICLRLGRPARAAVILAEIGSALEEDLGLYRALTRAAVGLDERDAPALLAAAEALGEAGMAATATDLLRLAEPLAPPRGAGELRRRIQQSRRRWAADVESVPLLAAGSAGVSGREWEVAELACARRTSREIADELGISIRTVDNHLRNLYRKLGVSGRAELRRALGAD